jgi:hypothetical protein
MAKPLTDLSNSQALTREFGKNNEIELLQWKAVASDAVAQLDEAHERSVKYIACFTFIEMLSMHFLGLQVTMSEQQPSSFVSLDRIASLELALSSSGKVWTAPRIYNLEIECGITTPTHSADTERERVRGENQPAAGDDTATQQAATATETKDQHCATRGVDVLCTLCPAKMPAHFLAFELHK